MLFFGALHSKGCIFLSFSLLPFISLLFSDICKASSVHHFAFLCFFSCGWSWSRPAVQSDILPSIVLQGHCRSNLFLDSICSFHCIITRDLNYVICEWSNDFPYFLQFKSKFGKKEFLIWATVSSQIIYIYINIRSHLMSCYCTC